ncbi:MAG: RNA methyltransferase [Planctomycetes bacterium]|nr:RNA methyltransferase [Planctomycetota bacterium]MCB9872068.1 RNA methyltransferase [Planctomycetota bacterium]
MDQPIRSAQNPLIRRFRAARNGEQPECMVAEGVRLVAEALAAAVQPIEIAWSPRLAGRPGGAELLERLKCLPDAERVLRTCSDDVLHRLSGLESHQGVAAILRRPLLELDALLGPAGAVPLVVVAAGVRDPGNLGALARSAEAAGATGLLSMVGSAEPFRDKALRGSAGSVFRLPCVARVTDHDALAWMRRNDLQILATDASASSSCWDVDLRRPTALLFGAEGEGVPGPLRSAAVATVAIPLSRTVESLNVAVAAGVLLFEARRQRR